MTFDEVYTEITKRAGQGYANYTDRAHAAFWKAVGDIIRSQDYQPEELRLASKREQAEAYLAIEFPYNLSNHEAIATDHVFSIQVELVPGCPENVHYTKLDERILHRAAYMKPLSAGGIKEVFYTLKYPHVIVTYNQGDSVLATAWTYVTITWAGVPRALVESTTQNNTDAGDYFTQQLVDRAIETAVKLMSQET